MGTRDDTSVQAVTDDGRRPRDQEGSAAIPPEDALDRPNNACGLVSVSPSAWEFSPIDVIWRRDGDGSGDCGTSIGNWWDATTLEDDLQTADPPIVSWDALRDVATRRFDALTFAGDCFTPTAGLPFAVSAAERHHSAVRHSEPARPRLR